MMQLVNLTHVNSCRTHFVTGQNGFDEYQDPAPACPVDDEHDPLPLQDGDLDDGKDTGEQDEPQDTGEQDEPQDVPTTLDPAMFVSMNVTKGDSTSRKWAPPQFMKRDAYKELVGLNLHHLPDAEGVGIHYHSSTSQWHASWPTGNKAPTWSDSLRSEAKAIVIALIALWTWYITTHPTHTAKEKEHLQKLKERLEALEF